MTTYLADYIGEEYETWGKGDIIVFDSPTGTGKTSFVLDVLLPYAISKSTSILYLVNRTALKKQVLEQVVSKYPSDYINSIHIITYQEFVLQRQIKGAYEKTEFGMMIDSALYWIMDESHYFLSDSAFNSTTHQCVEKISNAQKDHISIYITATSANLFLTLSKNFRSGSVHIPYLIDTNLIKYFHRSKFSSVDALMKHKELDDTICLQKSRLYRQNPYIDREAYDKYFDDLETKELLSRPRYFQNVLDTYAGIFSEIKARLKLYRIERDYSCIHPFYYSDDLELIEKICASPEGEKWLIFVDSKRRGHDIVEELLRRDLKDVVFVTKESKSRGTKKLDRAAFDYIVENSCFEQRVLVATSILDNGINIADEKVKHVVVESTDETAFLQMVGRRRIMSDADQFNLYLKAYSYGRMRYRFSRDILNVVLFLYTFTRSKESTEQPYRIHPHLSRYIDDGKFKIPYANYLKEAKDKAMTSNRAETKTKDNKLLSLDMYEIIPLYKNKLAYQYYYWLAWFEEMESDGGLSSSKDDIPFLKKRLSWIQQEYDPTRWINYPQQQSAQSLLEQQISLFHGGFMRTDQIEHFKKIVLQYAKELHPPDSVAKSKASLSSINKALVEWGYPYKVDSVEKYLNGKKGNYWTIRRSDLTT